MQKACWPTDPAPLADSQVAELSAWLRPHVAALAVAEQLDAEPLCSQLEPLLLPLAGWVALQRLRLGKTLVLGIAGAQGTGKTTLARLLELLLSRGLGLVCARLSLDDLYLTRAARLELAHAVHPLLRTRGVPGTHDVALGLRVLAELRSAVPGARVALPRFDKGSDERVPEAEWPLADGPIDCVLFDGWCLSATPEDSATLARPLNALERDEDADGRFRAHVNAQLAGPYRALFAQLDRLAFLAVPDLPASLAWRIEQEHKLAARAGAGRAVMSDTEVARFVQHYERISRRMLAELPGRADVTLQLGADHGYAAVAVR